ncbi:MAG: tRNA (adenosine(37)-N6)-threonylcarbamoyltransferase complex ATPase subunit type 1 TsaE [Micavibrio sp.]|nr:tRNA (adenosine(37)-N6)-threonylcarbamoyltransferase complex ATPase subunit type 1 TsaE [Micavibrio sp.]|tara:strand:- start:1850 stop:2290 length:441 start_codon:yes stop_codon:yes gene_type:complete
MQNPREFISESEESTARIAQELSSETKANDILCLYGTLGMGKSVFARALIRALCANPDLEIPSPTFTLVQTYETGQIPIWHFDLYRLEDPEEIYEIGWEEALDGGILIIEWPERLGTLKPSNATEIAFAASTDNANTRLITIKRPG